MKRLAHIPRGTEWFVFFMVCYFIADVLVALLLWRPPTAVGSEMQGLLDRTHRGILLIGCVVYAFRRSIHHPVLNTPYLEWLKTTPWQPGVPLPLGAVELRWRDAAVFAAAMALGLLHAHLPASSIVLAFAWPFAIIAVCTLISAQRPRESYLVALGLAVVLRLAHDPVPAAALILLLCAVAEYGLRRSLYAFPWDRKSKIPQVDAAWPMAAPVEGKLEPRVSSRQAVLAAILVGAWVWSIAAVIGVRNGIEHVLPFAATFILCGALIRFGIYCSRYHPPLSVLGRVFTGRLLLPRYDYVLLAPATAAAAGFLLLIFLCERGASSAVSLGASVATTLLILLGAGPSLIRWQLTGAHQIVIRSPSKAAVAKTSA